MNFKQKKTYILFFLILIGTFVASFFAGNSFYKIKYNIKTSVISVEENIDYKIPDEILNKISNDNDKYVKNKIEVESGSPFPSISDYFLEDSYDGKYYSATYYKNGKEELITNIVFIDEDNNLFTKGTGVYDVFFGEYRSQLVIVDTTAPSVVLGETTIIENNNYNANSFVKQYNDNSKNTDYNVSFVNDNDANYKKVGTYDVSIKVCDKSDNCFIGNTTLKIVKKKSEVNVQPPSIPETPTTPNNPVIEEPQQPEVPNTPVVPDTPNVVVPEDPIEEETPNNPDEPPTFVKKVELKVITRKEEIKYGVYTIYFRYDVYDLYSDGSKHNLQSTDEYSYIDYSGFNGTTSSMKGEAISLYSSLGNTRAIILDKTNAYREEVGASPLTIDKTLSIMANIRAIEIAYASYFSHTRPNGSQWHTIFDEYPYSTTYAGENLAADYDSDERACIAWKNSQGHYENMINTGFTKIGIGKYTFNGHTYWVQLFSKD